MAKNYKKLTYGGEINFICNFTTKIAKFFTPFKETFLSRQKKEQILLFCSRFFVTLASPNFLDKPSETSFESFALGKTKKSKFSFGSSLVFS